MAISFIFPRALRSETGPDGRPSFMGAVTTASTPEFVKYYFPIVVTVVSEISDHPSILPRIYLAKDPVDGCKLLVTQNRGEDLIIQHEFLL
jgi:hypothetical protein